LGRRGRRAGHAHKRGCRPPPPGYSPSGGRLGKARSATRAGARRGTSDSRPGPPLLGTADGPAAPTTAHSHASSGTATCASALAVAAATAGMAGHEGGGTAERAGAASGQGRRQRWGRRPLMRRGQRGGGAAGCPPAPAHVGRAGSGVCTSAAHARAAPRVCASSAGARRVCRPTPPPPPWPPLGLLCEPLFWGRWAY